MAVRANSWLFEWVAALQQIGDPTGRESRRLRYGQGRTIVQVATLRRARFEKAAVSQTGCSLRLLGIALNRPATTPLPEVCRSSGFAATFAASRSERNFEKPNSAFS
jgi:hypothetical protein